MCKLGGGHDTATGGRLHSHGWLGLEGGSPKPRPPGAETFPTQTPVIPALNRTGKLTHAARRRSEFKFAAATGSDTPPVAGLRTWAVLPT